MISSVPTAVVTNVRFFSLINFASSIWESNINIYQQVTHRPETTSSAVARRTQIVIMCPFKILFVSQYLNNRSADFQTVDNFGKASSISSSSYLQLDSVLILGRENWLQVGLSSSTDHINGWVRWRLSRVRRLASSFSSLFSSLFVTTSFMRQSYISRTENDLTRNHQIWRHYILPVGSYRCSTRKLTSWWGSAKRDVTHHTATVVYNTSYHLF